MSETITTLGSKYWTASMDLIEATNEKGGDMPMVNIPVFGALVLAESVEIKDDDPIAEVKRDAKSYVLREVKEILDAFMKARERRSEFLHLVSEMTPAGQRWLLRKMKWTRWKRVYEMAIVRAKSILATIMIMSVLIIR